MTISHEMTNREIDNVGGIISSSLYEPFLKLIEMLKKTEPHMAEEVEKLMPQCICKEEEPKAKAHHKCSDVVYYWQCPIHGERTEKHIMEMIRRN